MKFPSLGWIKYSVLSVKATGHFSLSVLKIEDHKCVFMRERKCIFISLLQWVGRSIHPRSHPHSSCLFRNNLGFSFSRTLWQVDCTSVAFNPQQYDFYMSCATTLHLNTKLLPTHWKQDGIRDSWGGKWWNKQGRVKGWRYAAPVLPQKNEAQTPFTAEMSPWPPTWCLSECEVNPQ